MIKRLSIISCIILICACQKDETIKSNGNQASKSEVVTFEINASSGWVPDVVEGMTRSEAIQMYCEEYEGSQIYMYMIEEDNPDSVYVHTIDTRAEGKGLSPTLGVYAFQSDSDLYEASPDATDVVFMDNLNLSTYGTESNPYLYWPGGGSWLKFFAYTPYSHSNEVFQIGSVGNQVSLTYIVPDILSEQYDIMDGASDLIPGNVTDAVSINLQHVLSKIRIKTGTLDEGVINSITFTNIYNKGDRIMATGSWNVDATSTSDYNHSFDPGIQPSSGTALGEEMYLLPQTLSDDAKIEIYMTLISPDPSGGTREHNYVLSRKLKDFTPIWEKDKIYTYVISTPEEVEIEVTDQISRNGLGQPVKDNLSIRNTGLSSVYVRAMLVGNWVLPNSTETFVDDHIVASWNPEEEGDFIWGADNGNVEPSTSATNGWYKHTDGYYYHLNPIPRGESTAKLFESYTLTAKPPVVNAVLDFTILVQAVYLDDLQLIWPASILDKFVNTVYVRE